MKRPLVVVPLGSYEQHGPHLPSTTDSVIINAVVRRATEGRDVVVVPPLHITASDEHAGFAGTLSIGTGLAANVLVAVARSAAPWSAGVLFANGHGGNHDALRLAAEELDTTGVRHASWSLPSYDGADMHAGLTETSVMLHLLPESVDMTRAEPGGTGTAESLLAAMRETGVRGVSDNGVLGDPTHASAEHGRAVLAMWVSSLARRLDALAVEWD